MSGEERCFFVLAGDRTTFQQACYNETAGMPRLQFTNVTFDGPVERIPDFDGLRADFDRQRTDIELLWTLVAGALVFFMQMGFSMLEAGAVRIGNVQNILFKNLLDVCIGSVIWFLFGFCVAMGDGNAMFGSNNFAIDNEDWSSFFFQWAFAATAATIVSGSVAERSRLTAYFSYTVFITGWVYPVVVHWIWYGDGWLSSSNPDASLDGGVVDFAGTGVVHLVGGWSGLMGSLALGPRLRRFDKHSDRTHHLFTMGWNVPFQLMGTLVLWFSWYGFNCGSTTMFGLASKVAVTTTLATAAGGLTAALVGRYTHGFWPVTTVLYGILAGLVSITGACASVGPWSAIAIGALGACCQTLASHTLLHFKVDDPIQAFPVHGACGVWGLLAVGLFSSTDNLEIAGYENFARVGHLTRFGNQIVAALLLVAWTCAMSGLLFFSLRYFGVLRVSPETEKQGMDKVEHGGIAVSFRGHEELSESRDRRHVGHISSTELPPLSSEDQATMGSTMGVDPNTPMPSVGGGGADTPRIP